MQVWDGRLYVTACNMVTGLEIWEYDGINWKQVNIDGFGDVNNTMGPSMAVFQDNLYVGTMNTVTGCEIWRYDGSNWIQVNTDGFGDVNNKGALSMTVLGNNLYVGTANPSGCQVWRYDGSNWIQVNTDGFGDEDNVCAFSMAIFDNDLYVGTKNCVTGCEVWQMKTIIPDIKANNSDGPIALNQSDRLTVNVTLDNNGITDNADWWLAADTPFGLYFYTFDGWRPYPVPVHQGPLFYLDSYEVFSMPVSVLQEGTYTLYFGVDTVMDGDVTWDSVYYDTVEVNITE